MFAAVEATQKVHWNSRYSHQRHSDSRPGNSLANHCHLWVHHLEISTGFPLDSGTRFPTIKFLVFFYFYKNPTHNAWQLAPSSKYPLRLNSNRWFSWHLMCKKPPKWEMDLPCSKERRMSLFPWTRGGSDKDSVLDKTLVRFLWALFQLDPLIEHGHVTY